MTTTDLAGLIAKLENASEGSPALDEAVQLAVFPEMMSLGGVWHLHGIRVRMEEYTRSLDAALTLVPEGWWWSAGLCGLSGHVTIGPDYNGPHRERLLREFPEDKWHEGVSVDLEPGDGIHRTCLAICAAVLKARAALGSQS